MYNKLFTKILDSSIWLEPTTTRIVWLTLIAGMDEDGFVALASVANLAHRARVERKEAEEAVQILESPDPDSSDPDHEGRRIERVTGGWMVLNGPKYRDLVTRTVSREQTRARVAKHRAKKSGNAQVTPEKRSCNGYVTQSDAVTHTNSETFEASKEPSAPSSPVKSKASGYTVPACFESVDGFSVTLAAWIEHRHKIKKAVTGHTVQLMVNRLSERPEDAVEALNMTMEKGWASVKWAWFDNEKSQELFQRNRANGHAAEKPDPLAGYKIK